MFVKEKLKLFDELDDEKCKKEKEAVKSLLMPNPPDDLLSFMDKMISVQEQPFYSTRPIFP